MLNFKLICKVCVVSTAMVGFACTSGTKEPTNNNMMVMVPESFDRGDVLLSIANNVIQPTYENFSVEAKALESSLMAYKSAMAMNPVPGAELDAARAAWKKTMSAWQKAEVLQLGPVGDKAKRVRGENLRDEIFSWPTVSTCSVDKELVYNKFTETTFFAQTLLNAYGLDALEYLLFEHSMENTCSVLSDINSTMPRWSDLSENELQTRRADYAYEIGRQLSADATRIVDAWSPSGGNFFTHLTKPGTDESEFETELDALNDLFAALFYVELVVKDRKLALPAGLSVDCMEMNCPEKLESRWAKHSRENIIANLQVFRSAFVGGDATDETHIGFDDYLKAVNSEELATSMLKKLDDTIALLEGQTETFHDALSAQSTNVVDAHDALKGLTDLLKTQFVSVLGLEVPREGAGDND